MKKDKQKKKRKYLTKKRREAQKKNLKRGMLLIILFSLSIPLTLFQFLISLDRAIPVKVPHPLCGTFENIKPDSVRYIPTTAYSSTIDQTDSTPFITANGTRVHWGVVATNFLPFKTCIRFPDLFGEQFFVVEDRKHIRFSSSIDIWFPTRDLAKRFGKRTLKVEIWR